MSADYPARTVARHWEKLWADATPAERAVLPYIWGLWLRGDQEITDGPWRGTGFFAGRGFGKSHACATYLNRKVAQGHGRLGNGFALCAQNDRAVLDIQLKALVETALPWDVPRATSEHVKWPSGAEALIFSAESREAGRGPNLEITWCTEIVFWNRSNARAVWENFSLATRLGLNKMIFDSTSKGRCPIALDRVSDNAANPDMYRLYYGTTYDNPLLGAGFMADIEQKYPNKASRRYQEEILGQVFTEAGNALWQAEWIEDNRRDIAPTDPELVILALDPSRSLRDGSDEFGIVVAARGRDQEIYVLEDHSGRLGWDQVVRITLDRCLKDAAGFVWESNNAASTAVVHLLNVEAAARGMTLHILPKDARFPRRHPGRIYVREAHTDKSKEARADAPSALYAAGKVHHVGNLSQLEEELTTWEPGEGKSPNRLDALVYAVAELGGVATYGAPRASAAEAAAVAHAQSLMRQQPARGVENLLRVRDPRSTGRGRTI